jgi:uncharacterized lipoprotein YajG
MQRREVMKLAVFPLSAVLLLAACSTHTTTTRTESYETSDSSSRPVTRTETTEVERSSTESNGGVISGTIDIIGKTLALPFRAVGGLIDVIF